MKTTTKQNFVNANSIENARIELIRAIRNARYDLNDAIEFDSNDDFATLYTRASNELNERAKRDASKRAFNGRILVA